MATPSVPKRPVRVAAALTMLASLIAGGTTAAAASHGFDDVPSDHPFHAQISWLVDEGVADGYGDGTFRPGAEVTRQAMVTFLYRMAGEPPALSRSGFVDVPDSHPFHDAVAWAAGEGFATGYEDGTFRPGAEVTRQAAAAFLFRAVEGSAGDAGSTFADVEAGHRFQEEISWLAAEGISRGYADGTFRPSTAVTRQAIAAFLQRTVEEGHTVDVPDPATVRLSVAADGTQANGASRRPSISADGRFVAFFSVASNLVPDDTNEATDVFVHDQETGRTERVSVASDGSQGDGISTDPSISADGRFVAFQSAAPNLVPDDTNGYRDIFVHDRQTGQTERVSLATDGSQADDHHWEPSISADGRYVAFHAATHAEPGHGDVFVHDRQTAETSRVTVATDGGATNGQSSRASISADGRYVAFDSSASNLVLDDTNGTRDIFVHDRQTGQTELAAPDSWDPSISADGRYVAFRSNASDLVPDDTNGATDIFVHDRQTDTIDRISVDSGGAQADGGSTHLSISADGRFVAFLSDASNLVPGDTNDAADVFVRDRWTDRTDRVSVDSAGAQAGMRSVEGVWPDPSSAMPSISADGRHIAFHSWASTLVPDDTNDTYDVFVRRRW